MNDPVKRSLLKPAAPDPAREKWESEYAQSVGADRAVENVSGIPVKPLYDAGDWSRYGEPSPLGYPGQPDYTRGIYASMHRGRTWTQRQLIGLGTPADYNARLLDIMAQGATAVSLIPCNSVFRGYDMDSVDAELLGTCGVVVNSVEHMERCLAGVDIERVSCAMNDPSPFTLLAFLVVAAERRGVPLAAISGTSNQSDYLSHFVANHMFFRLALPGARRVLVDHIDWCNRHLPRWNPMSVVGQHMQQAGATPAEAMAFTLATAIQNAEDCIARGMDPDSFLPRFTFFFDISVNFFEEVAKFRAGRRLWARIARERLGAKDPRSWRFKFHGQTSGRRSDAATAAEQHRAGHGSGDGRHLRWPAVAAHRRLRRSAGDPERVRRAHRGGHTEHPARGSPPDRRHRSARWLVLRRNADRPDAGEN
jgi:methylmalonyl-CoA mutase, N-terminal domain